MAVVNFCVLSSKDNGPKIWFHRFNRKLLKDEILEKIKEPVNRRRATRFRCLELIGIAIQTQEKREFKFEAIDVSETGLSIFSSELLAKGDSVLIIFNKTSIRLEVVWVTAHEEKKLFKYGLVRINESQNLADIFPRNVKRDK